MRRPRGFTLLEVLVALAVVATALYAATGSVRSAARGSGYLEQTTLAHWAALNALNEFEIAGNKPNSLTSPQTTLLYGHEFIVSVQQQPAANEEEEGKRIIVTVAETLAPEAVLYTLSVASP